MPQPPSGAPGRIVAGALAPHPPHLVYADNPPQNEPRAEGGWDVLRWGYERLRANLARKQIDVILVHSPHWRTVQGHHVLALPQFSGLSVDPIFPNLFRYRYDLRVDVELAQALVDEGRAAGLHMQPMTNPDFRVDYGTITSCHLARPTWDLPIVAISSNRAYHLFNNDVGDAEMTALGEATARAVARTGRRALLLASNSLSHRHFTREPDPPEDMSQERIYHHGQYLWDMHVLSRMRRGQIRELMAEMPDFIEQATSECKEGSLTWLLAALGFPTYGAEVHAYGTVIGTGNAVVEWDPEGVRA
jgi:2-aminophenol/2-amino-5-chlorophenol 1,6-dioxygenase beta subunit